MGERRFTKLSLAPILYSLSMRPYQDQNIWLLSSSWDCINPAHPSRKTSRHNFLALAIPNHWGRRGKWRLAEQNHFLLIYQSDEVNTRRWLNVEIMLSWLNQHYSDIGSGRCVCRETDQGPVCITSFRRSHQLLSGHLLPISDSMQLLNDLPLYFHARYDTS